MKWLKKFIDKYRLDLWILEGEELNSKTSLTVLCSAHDWSRNHLAKLIFGETYHEHYVGQSWLWNISKIAQKMNKEYSIVIIEIRNKRRKFLETGNWFYSPTWVDGITDLPLKSTITKRESLKSDLRKIKKHDLQFEVTQDEEYFNDFYYHMYIPYITRAHGSSAYIFSYKEMKKQFDNGELLLIKKGEIYIAGIIINYTETSPRLKSLGIREGSSEYLNCGAMAALYHFSLQYLEERGFSKINYGFSRAFLKDGVLQYKKKWGQKIDGVSFYIFAIKILSYTKASQMFLEKNPFIFKNKTDLCGAVFLNTTEPILPQEIEKIYKSHFYNGLSKLYIFLPPENSTLKSNDIPAKFSGQIIFKSANELIAH